MITNQTLFNLVPSGTELSANIKRSAESKTEKSFDNFLNQTKKSDSSARDRADNTLHKQTERKKVRSDDTRAERKDEKNNNKDTIKKEDPKDSSKVTEQTDEVKKAAPSEDNKTQKADDIDEKVLNDLSVILNIPKESIMQILNNLNMSLNDLANRANLDLFMRQVYDVTSAGQLLQIPDIKTVFDQVKQQLTAYETAGSVQNHAHARTESESAGILPETAAQLSENRPDMQNSDNPQDTESELFGSLRQNMVVASEPKTNSATTKPTDFASMFIAVDQEPVLSENMDHTAMAMLNQTHDSNESVRFNNLTSKTEASRNINTQDVINQITENVKIDVRNNVSEIRISLRPEHLGDVTLKVLTENGIITAQFVAENQRVKEIIESNFNQLRDTLQQQGIQLSELSVSVGQDTDQERMDSFLRGQQEARTRVRHVNGIAIADAAETVADEIKNLDPWQETGNQVNFTA